MEIRTREHRRNTSDLVQAVANKIPDADASAFDSIVKCANVAKHQSWIRAQPKAATQAIRQELSEGIDEVTLVAAGCGALPPLDTTRSDACNDYDVKRCAARIALVLRVETLEQELSNAVAELRGVRELLRTCTEERDWLRQQLENRKAFSAGAEVSALCDTQFSQQLRADMDQMKAELSALCASAPTSSADAENSVIERGIMALWDALRQQGKDTTGLIRGVIDNLEKQIDDGKMVQQEMMAKGQADTYSSISQRLDGLGESIASLRYVPQELRTGKPVWFRNLRTAADLNGTIGTLKQYEKESGQCVVESHIRDKDIKCKATNLVSGGWCTTCEVGIGASTCRRCGRSPVPYWIEEQPFDDVGNESNYMSGHLDNIPCPVAVQPTQRGGATRGEVEKIAAVTVGIESDHTSSASAEATYQA